MSLLQRARHWVLMWDRDGNPRWQAPICKILHERFSREIRKTLAWNLVSMEGYLQAGLFGRYCNAFFDPGLRSSIHGPNLHFSTFCILLHFNTILTKELLVHQRFAFFFPPGRGVTQLSSWFRKIDFLAAEKSLWIPIRLLPSTKLQ